MKKKWLPVALLAVPPCPGMPQAPYHCPDPASAPLALLSVPPPGAKLVKAKTKGTGRYLVTRNAPTGALFLESASASGATVDVVTPRTVAMSGLNAASLHALEQDPTVIRIEEEQVYSVEPLLGGQHVQADVVPWHLDIIDSRRGLDGKYEPGATGAGVHVFIIDTGTDCSGSLEGRCGEGFSSITNGDPIKDGHGHGTHVGNLVASQKYGSAKAISALHPVQVLDASGSGTTSGVVQGIAWARTYAETNHLQGRCVANMSLGGGRSPTLDEEAGKLVAAGCVLVVAAGNESSDATGTSPAAVDCAVTVGASQRDYHAASFSNFGQMVDVWSPGKDVESYLPGGKTAVWSGTSMASPIVAGVAALCIERGWTDVPRCIRETATPDLILDAPANTTHAFLFAGQTGAPVPTPTPPPTPEPTPTPPPGPTPTPTPPVRTIPQWDLEWSDGCSVVNLVSYVPPEVDACCMLHDSAYYYGGSREDRAKADMQLYDCVRQAKLPDSEAELWLLIVDAVGGPEHRFERISWAWGPIDHPTFAYTDYPAEPE